MKPTAERSGVAVLRAAVNGLLRPPYVSEVAGFEQPLRTLADEEQAAVARAGQKRRREFQAGRHCAQSALRRLGQPETPLVQQPDRQPRWPDSVVGSISHAGSLPDGCAIAVVAPKSRVAGLGVDVEVNRPLGSELWSHILTPEETDRLQQLDEPHRGHWALWHFSAKEAFYKAQFPTFQRRLGFRDVSLRLQAQGELTTFEVAVRDGPIQQWLQRHGHRGQLVQCGDWVLSAFSVGANQCPND